MAEKRDYYEVLGIGKNATDAEIKSAYRKLAPPDQLSYMAKTGNAVLARMKAHARHGNRKRRSIGAEKIFSKTPKGRRRGCLAAA